MAFVSKKLHLNGRNVQNYRLLKILDLQEPDSKNTINFFDLKLHKEALNKWIINIFKLTHPLTVGFMLRRVKKKLKSYFVV